MLPFVLFFLFVFAIVKTNKTEPKLLLQTTQKTFAAANPIVLTFATDAKTELRAKLFIIHTYGKTVLEATATKAHLSFRIPSIYCRKTGLVSWYLVHNQKTLNQGTFEIIPNDASATLLENYLGPPTILAGKKHFTMLVAIPTDAYDNPKQNNTTVVIKDQFLDRITVSSKKTASFIAWKNIYSRTKSGKMLVSSQCNSTSSKEFETEITPSVATNFSIQATRNHAFADGNQITTLETTIIRDQYNNIVADGTLVTFQITTKNNTLLKTYAATINGIAKGQLLHPDHAENYQIKAYIIGIAQSKPIVVRYQALIGTFAYQFSDQNRKITVGPLTSFMQQRVPDGIKVTLKILHNQKVIETKIAETAKGMARFYLHAPFYKEKEYQFEITTLGITQQTQLKKYESH